MSEPKSTQSAFEIVLASTVHDMKNSLGMLLSAIDRITHILRAEDSGHGEDYNIVQYEAKRTNNALVKLLSLYKMEKKQLPLNVEYHFLDDFLHEQVSEHNALLDAKAVTVSYDIEEDLEWCFDESLIASVINDVITNTIRYTKANITVSAITQDNFLVITVADDGEGYPSFMIENPDSYALAVNFSTGSTGLGLYFAANVAALHRNKNHEGKIKLSNGGKLGGGNFSIFIP